MPRELGMLRPGGENVEQFAEYHRSKRLAEVVLDADHPKPSSVPVEIDRETAADLFVAWSRERRPDWSRPDELEDLAAELAGSWRFGGAADLYRTCSPHRVALTVELARGSYEDDFAAGIVELLPDWTAWLAERHGTPAYLAERCLPAVHAPVNAEEELNYLARTTE